MLKEDADKDGVNSRQFNRLKKVISSVTIVQIEKF